MLRYRFAATLLITIIMFISCSSPRVKNIEVYGKRDVPVWEPITAFEYSTLIEAKNSTSPETLLKLSLFLTDLVREEADAAPLIEKYRELVKKLTPEIEKEKDPLDKGRKLLYFMHTELLGTLKSGETKNYVENQTSIPILLENGKYNCNSSAIIYGILALHFGLEPSAALLKEHAFITLKIPGREKPVDVETTGALNFDKPHDLAFFKEESMVNPKSFPDPSKSLEEYNAKTVMKFRDFILMQFSINQRFDTDRRIVDLRRRSEIAGFLSEDPKVMKDRAITWNNIYVDLSAKYNKGQLLPFTSMIEKELERASSLCSQDREYRELASNIYIYSAIENGINIRPVELAKCVGMAYKFLDTDASAYANNKQNLVYAVDMFMRGVVEKDIVEKSIPDVNIVVDAIPDIEAKKGVLAAFYYNAATDYFQKEKWSYAARMYRECNDLDKSKTFDVCADNSQVSFTNWAVTMKNDGKSKGAIEALDLCLKYFPTSEKCKDLKKEFSE